MNGLQKLLSFIILFVFTLGTVSCANKSDVKSEKEEFVVKDLILEHVADSYEWHITKWGDTDIVIPLPIIIYSKYSGWQVFMSSALRQEPEYNGLFIAEEGKYKGKIIERDAKGQDYRPFDISITKVALSLIINSILLIIIILYVARSYKKGVYESKKGFIGFMEMLIMEINDEVIKPCIGADYKRFSPYLLTVFFFIFINNLMGLIPLFPGGANVTGNIAITFVLAICTFLIVNISGTKTYWKEIFWPDVPLWLKFPFPLMPIIEIVGVISKPFALMIRLFANMLAGHSITLGLSALIFVTVSMGQVINTEITIISVVFTVFINFVELLVAYIQAYVFTMLSAVFIGLARVKAHH